MKEMIEMMFGITMTGEVEGEEAEMPIETEIMDSEVEGEEEVEKGKKTEIIQKR